VYSAFFASRASRPSCAFFCSSVIRGGVEDVEDVEELLQAKKPVPASPVTNTKPALTSKFLFIGFSFCFDF
jgi:hypothetical protein